jgi:hypothetical protein
MSKELSQIKCLTIIYNMTSKDLIAAKEENLYEKAYIGFLKTQGFSPKIIKQACLSESQFDKKFNLTDNEIEKTPFINCETLKKTYNVSLLCSSCDYSPELSEREKAKESISITKIKTPPSIKEGILLNLAQQHPIILKAIAPKKLVSLGQNKNKDTHIYREFYNYLIDENSVKEESVLEVLKTIYNENEKVPMDIKEIKEKNLTYYLKIECVSSVIKLINELTPSTTQAKQDQNSSVRNDENTKPSNETQLEELILKETITILSSDNEDSNNLLKSKYISIKVESPGYHVFGDSNLMQPYIIPISDSTMDLITKIVSDNKIRVISKDVDTRNHFIKKHNLQVIKSLPLKRIASAAGISIENLDFKDYIKQYKKIEKQLGKSLHPLLSYITFSMKTSKEIEITPRGNGFYNTIVIDDTKEDNECIFEVNMEKFVENIRYARVNYKDVYQQIAIGINKQNQRKVPFEIVELSKKFRVKCKNDRTTKLRINELIIQMLFQINILLTGHDGAYLQMKYYE